MFNKIKEFMGDPKKKALTQLALYGIFFIFVFMFINAGSSSTTDYIPSETTNTVSSYEYIYKINNNEIIEEITGTLQNNEDVFNYKGINYNKKEDIIYLNNEPITLDFDIDKYKYDKIELLTLNSDSKTTYTDNNKVVYNMSMKEYFTLLNENNNCENMDCTLINALITVESDDYINHVIIDLSNYYGYKYNIEIHYNNINKISTN